MFYTQLLSFLLSLVLIIFYTLTFFRLFLAVLGLCCCVWAFSSGSGWRLFFVAACGLLIMVASFVAEHRLLAHGLQHAAQGLSSCRVLPQLLHCMWDLSQTKDLTHVSSIGRWILNHWTTGETLFSFFNCLKVFMKEESYKKRTWLHVMQKNKCEKVSADWWKHTIKTSFHSSVKKTVTASSLAKLPW